MTPRIHTEESRLAGTSTVSRITHLGNRELRHLKEARDACRLAADRMNRRAVFAFVVSVGAVGCLLCYLILTTP